MSEPSKQESRASPGLVFNLGVGLCGLAVIYVLVTHLWGLPPLFLRDTRDGVDHGQPFGVSIGMTPAEARSRLRRIPFVWNLSHVCVQPGTLSTVVPLGPDHRCPGPVEMDLYRYWRPARSGNVEVFIANSRVVRVGWYGIGGYFG